MGRNIDENENLARAPLALADSFEISLPPCFVLIKKSTGFDKNIKFEENVKFEEKKSNLTK